MLYMELSNMESILVFLVILAVVALAGSYIYKEKKKGATCIGCPHSGSCASGCGGCSAHCSGCRSQSDSPSHL